MTESEKAVSHLWKGPMGIPILNREGQTPEETAVEHVTAVLCVYIERDMEPQDRRDVLVELHAIMKLDDPTGHTASTFVARIVHAWVACDEWVREGTIDSMTRTTMLQRIVHALAASVPR